MFSKGLVNVTKGGSHIMPPEIIDPWDTGFFEGIPPLIYEIGYILDSWSLMGRNKIVISLRLKRLGWEPTETKKETLMEYLPELELAISKGL